MTTGVGSRSPTSKLLEIHSASVGDNTSEVGAVELSDLNMLSCVRRRIDLEGVVVDEVEESTTNLPSGFSPM